ncbi:Helicase C-terminal [Trinorchestia longiramus]|nr:Helicase C-terminal [Trinorchestia longiramus]
MSVDWAKASEEQEAEELASKVLNMGLPKDGPQTSSAPPFMSVPPPSAAPPSFLSSPPPPLLGASPAVATGLSTAAPAAQPPSGHEEDSAPSAAELSLMRKALCKGIIESKNDVEVLRKDPNSPLYSVKTFEALQLRPELLQGIYDMGFKLPSKIQETALPTLLANPPQNLIAQSQSGTGKTAAFSLGLLSRIDPSKKCTQALCLSPTYELALQTAETVKTLGRHCTDVTIKCAVKGERLSGGHKITDHIVIGTPGKVLDWLTKNRALSLNECSVFVLDEADVMIATQGHQDQSVRIHKQLPKNCQMMLFSATYDGTVMQFAEAIVPNPVIIRLRREEETLTNIRQMYVECHTSEEKYTAISNIYTIPVGQSMFFCRTKQTANWLHSRMIKDGHHVALLTGDLSPEERLSVLTRYREGRERVLICTNVLARGIDVEQVTLVVNYDLPELNGSADCETYLHRIGRTGRFGKTGNAINIIDGPRSMELLEQIQRHFSIEIKKLDYKDFDEIEKLAED